MNKLLIVCCMFLCASCAMSWEANNYIAGTNYGSEDWRVGNNSSWYFGYVSGYEKKYGEEISVKVELYDVVCSQGKVHNIDIIIPYSYSFGCDKKCDKANADRENRTIEVVMWDNKRKTAPWGKAEQADWDWENNYTFDPTKVYFIKDGQKHHLGNPLNKDAKIRDLNRINDISVRQTFFSFKYPFPFICGELEDTVLIIDGFSANGKPLEPLTIKLNYIDPTKVPFYNKGE